MRTVSSALKSAQASPNVKPYISICLTCADGGCYDYSHRLVQLEHHEEPYNDWADIILYNNDRGVAELRGCWLEIGYGCIIPSGGVEYSDTPRLWVKSTQQTSREGDLFMVLNCEGMCANLRDLDIVTKGEPPYYSGQYEEEYTIFDTIKDILEAGGYTLNDIGDQSDGIIGVLTPRIWMNQYPFENPMEVIYRLIAMTKCFLRPLASKQFEVVFPQEADDVLETYHSDSPHYFHEYVEKLNLTIPNHIIVYANASGDEEAWDVIIAEAEDEESIAMCKNICSNGKITRHHIAADLDNATDATNRASAILTRLMFEKLAGRVLVPHDCRVELYDRVGIYDRR